MSNLKPLSKLSSSFYKISSTPPPLFLSLKNNLFSSSHYPIIYLDYSLFYMKTASFAISESNYPSKVAHIAYFSTDAAKYCNFISQNHPKSKIFFSHNRKNHYKLNSQLLQNLIAALSPKIARHLYNHPFNRIIGLVSTIIKLLLTTGLLEEPHRTKR